MQLTARHDSEYPSHSPKSGSDILTSLAMRDKKEGILGISRGAPKVPSYLS